MSISSSEGITLPNELTSKYQKLAAEYAKLRSQVNVLKKAVVDEQAKAAELKEEVKTKDQTLRKHGQEIESLTFRNQQLTKRVTVLQDELDAMQLQGNSKRGKPRKETPAPVQDSSILQEEFHKKISENARLVSLLEEKLQQHEQERQLWNETAAGYKDLIRESENPCKICNCDNLSHGITDRSKTESLTTNSVSQSSPSRILTEHPLRQLPLVDLLNSVQDFIYACLPNDKPSKHSQINQSLEQLSLCFSPEYSNGFSQLFQDYLTHYDALVSKVSDRCAKKLLYELREPLKILSASITECLAKGASPVGNELSQVDSSIRLFHRAVQECPIYSVPMDSRLSKLEESCKKFRQSLTSLPLNAEKLKPCEQCNVIRRHLEEKIVELERKILELPGKAVIDNTASLAPSTRDDLSLNLDIVENEFGAASLLRETIWKDQTVKDLVHAKVNQTVTDRLIAESKLTRLMEERDVACRRLEQCSEELKEVRRKAANLEEELSYTSKSYEDQLSSMSEHLAAMNDRLVVQDTQIEQLSYALQPKEQKRGWTK